MKQENTTLILSKDPFEIKEQTKIILSEFTSEEVIQLAGESLSEEELSKELNTLPFLSKKRVIIVTEIQHLKTSVKDVLLEYLNAPSSEIILLLTGEILASNTKLYKKISKVIDLRKEKKPWEMEQSLTQWVIQYLSQSGKSIDISMAKIIVQSTNGEKNFIRQELDKLICYLGKKEKVDSVDIEAVITKVFNDSVWTLGETILSKDCPNSLQILHSLFLNGSELLGLLAQVRSQVRKSCHICSLASAQQVSDHYPYLKGNLLNKQIELAKGYGMERFRKAFIKIDEIERAAKSSKAEPIILAEQLVIALAS